MLMVLSDLWLDSSLSLRVMFSLSSLFPCDLFCISHAAFQIWSNLRLQQISFAVSCLLSCLWPFPHLSY